MYNLYRAIILLCFVNISLAFSEETITAFNEKFALNIFGNYNVGVFKQRKTLSYRTDEPWDIGLGVRYKNLSAQISIPISSNGTSFDLELNSYFDKIYFELFLKRYRDFYNDKEITYNDAGLDITSAGIAIGWIHNNKNHSLSSVYSLNKKQNISSGGFLYGFGGFFTSIYSDNYDMKRYNSRKRLIYFGPITGYSYTWILPYDIFINVGMNIGTNLGISATENEVLFIPQMKPKIGFGLHNGTWSVNTVISSNATVILWGKNDIDVFAPSTMTVTFSKRF
jgi:hypothetical protein